MSKFVTENAYCSHHRREKISILIRMSVTKTIEFGRVERKGCSRSRAARFRAAQFRAAQYRAERFSAAAALKRSARY